MDMKKHLTAILTLSMAMGISTVMPASVVMATTNSTTATSMTSTTTNNSQFSKDQIAGLNHLNAIRKSMGLHPVKLSPLLTKTADDHIKYITSNGNSVVMQNKHRETAGNPYYTGETVTDRVNAAGGSFTHVSEAIGDSNSSPDAIDSFITGIYHRTAFLEPNLEYIGIASSGSLYVIDVVYYNNMPSNIKSTAVYPYDGQTNVPLVTGVGAEYPDPVAYYPGIVGYGISVYIPNAENEGTWHFTLTDSQGHDLGVYTQGSSFFPKKELKHNEKYTATATLTSPSGAITYHKKWSFTTKLSKAEQFAAKYNKLADGKPIGKIIINQDIGTIDSSGNYSIQWHKGATYNVYGVSVPYSSVDEYDLGKYGKIDTGAGVTFFLGIVYSPHKPLTVYNSDGSIYKHFKANQKFRVTSEQGNKLYVAKDKYVLKSSSIVFQK